MARGLSRALHASKGHVAWVRMMMMGDEGRRSRLEACVAKERLFEGRRGRQVCEGSARDVKWG